jgi:hypothetical protein
MTADPLIELFAESLAGKTDGEIELIAHGSPAVHFACYCRIRDKNNAEITPVPNILQLRMSEAYESLRDMGVKIRIIVTKPRRAGCSTFGAHILYHHGRKTRCDGIAISDKKEHSTSLLDKLKAYSSNDAYPWGIAIVANPSQSIEWTNGTKWTIDTAENSNAAVGDTNQLGFFSEVSKWPQTTAKNDAKVMAAVLPTLSGSETVAIAESTPEGATGWQYATWQDAVTLDEFIRMHAAGFRPEEQWVKVFAAWFEFQDNRRQNPVGAAEIAQIEATLDDHERDEIAKYGLDWEQIAWRRDTIRSVCKGDPKVFSYYYPSDDVSCWLASGSPRFDMQILAEMESAARGAVWETGHLVTQHTGRVAFQRDPHGQILLCEPPRTGLRYVVVLDPATDASQTIGADPDRHSLSVWRAGYRDTSNDAWRPAKKVCRLKPPFYGDGDEVAGHAVRLAKFYGNALYCQEVNCGLDILRLVREAGVACYKRRPLSHRTGKIVEQYGFRLNDQQDRNAIIEGFAAAIRERAIEVTCFHSIGEYKAFITKTKGRAEAAAGAHDDDVLADCMAWEVLPSASEYRETKAQHVDPPDRHTWRKVNGVRRGW